MNSKIIGLTLEKILLKLGNSLSLLSDYEYDGRVRYLKIKWELHTPLVTERKFPEGTMKIDRPNFRKKEIKYHRCAVFVSFRGDGTINEPLLFYLSELNKAVDTLIFVADCPLFPEEAEKLVPYADYILCERHGEYDFGSYKRGFEIAEKYGHLTNTDQLVFCNDSCFGPFRPFQEYFDRFKNTDFSGMWLTEWGYKMATNRIYVDDILHIDSYFITVSRKVFGMDSFRQFFQQVKKEQYKVDVICKYEQGITDLLISEGFQPEVWFPPRPKESCHYNWTEMHWNDTVKKGFLLKKDILSSPRLFSPFNETVTQTIFPFKIENGKLVKRSVK